MSTFDWLTNQTGRHQQSWTKLVETNKMNALISQFPCMEKPTRLCKWFPSPPPSPRSMLFGRTEVSSSEVWWQSNIDNGERGKDLLW